MTGAPDRRTTPVHNDSIFGVPRQPADGPKRERPAGNTWSGMAETEDQAAERRQRRAAELLGDAPREPPVPLFPKGAPTPAEILNIPRDPKTGKPLEEGPPLGYAYDPRAPKPDWVLRNEAKLAEFYSPAGLGDVPAHVKITQINADLRWGQEDSPQWHIEVPLDPAFPPVVLRAADAEHACARYASLCGITAYSALHPPAATPYVEEAPAP
jgi:hypothetical protein